MPILANIRHERFARCIAKGLTKSKAYEIAGYTPSAQNAHRLYRLYPTIRNRVEQLMKKDSSNLTAQDILDHVYSTFELAYNSEQATAALKALEMLGKEKGLWKDRRENLNINLGTLDWNDTVRVLTERYGERASIFIDLLSKLGYGAEKSSVGEADQSANASYLQLDYVEED